jgi:3-hydroxyacyl-CoA dehydrogenase
VCRTVEQHVEDGRLGVKSGRGFYDDDEPRLAELTSRPYRAARQLEDQ